MVRIIIIVMNVKKAGVIYLILNVDECFNIHDDEHDIVHRVDDDTDDDTDGDNNDDTDDDTDDGGRGNLYTISRFSKESLQNHIEGSETDIIERGLQTRYQRWCS